MSLRRAIDETLADGQIELSRRSGWPSRTRGRLAIGLAVARLLIASRPFANGGHPMRHFTGDVRHAFQRLRRAPLFAGLAIVILALGLAANTVVFSLINAFLFRPLAVEDPARLVSVGQSRMGRPFPPSPEDFDAIRSASADIFTDVARFRIWQGGVSTPAGADVVSGEFVSPRYFAVVRPRLLQGRTLDDAAGAADVVISESLARRLFSGRPVGQPLRVSGRPFTVVGVLDDSYRGLHVPSLLRAEMWLPEAASEQLTGRLQGGGMRAIGRVRPDRAPESVGPALDVLNARLAAGLDSDRPALAAAPIDEALMPGSFETFGVAVGTAVIAMSMMVLLIACANLTNLLLARAASRTGEIAIRRSLGASRLRVFRLLFVETAMVVSAGGLGGLLLAAWVVELLGRWTPTYEGITFAPDLSLDGRVFLFTALASAIAALVIGTVPAWRGARTEAASLLQSAGAQRWSGRRGRLSSILVGAQLAASVVLLAGATLFGRSALETLRHDVGFDLYGPALVRTNVELHGYDEAQGRRYYERILEAARAVPEIRQAALVDWPIFGPRNNPLSAVAEGLERGDGRGVSGSFSRISPGFLATVNIPLLRGRDFTNADGPGVPLVVIVNQRLASALWSSADPLGRRLRLRDDSPWLEVVGVAADTDVRVPRSRRPYAFVPFAQHYVPEMAVIANGDARASALVQPLAAAVRSVAPDVALMNATTLEGSVNVLMLAERLGAIALLILGVLGAGIALVGIYGIVAYLVGLRVKEIGIRLALGATRPQVVSLLVRQGARMLVAGLVPGVLLAFAVAAMVRSFLFRLPANDPAAYLIAPATLLFAGLLACYLPARRAAQVDPNVALRDL